jgi:hypothetical protein
MIVSKAPVVDLFLATGYGGFVLGASGRVDVMSSVLSNAALAASYIGPDYVASAHTDVALKRIRGTLWQQLDAASSVAAEVVHDTAADDVMLTMGYCHAALDGARSSIHAQCFSVRGIVHAFEVEYAMWNFLPVACAWPCQCKRWKACGSSLSHES